MNFHFYAISSPSPFKIPGPAPDWELLQVFYGFCFECFQRVGCVAWAPSPAPAWTCSSSCSSAPECLLFTRQQNTLIKTHLANTRVMSRSVLFPTIVWGCFLNCQQNLAEDCQIVLVTSQHLAACLYYTLYDNTQLSSS